MASGSPDNAKTKKADESAGKAARPAEVSGSNDAPSIECQFNESIIVSCGSHHPQYDKSPVKAYAARGEDKYPANLFALVCDDALTPRMRSASAYASISNPAMARLVATGPAFWPPSNKEKFLLIYENNLGNPLMRDDLRGGLGIRPEAALSNIIRPMISVLLDLRDREVFHGNIRPANMFDGGKRGLERIILGDCLCLPPSYNQPVLYETIERAMTSPVARQPGPQSADLYAFGVSLALLMRHQDPMEGYSDEEIVEKKMEDGSYAALLGKDRFSGAILELLRGLLHDEDDQRWTLDEINIWLDGRRLSPKQSTRRLKAGRPLSFNGNKYSRPELLARDLTKNVSEARHLIESGDMEQWLQRALEDRGTSERFDKAVIQAAEGGKGAGYAERLATRTAIALQPEGPIRFKTSSVHPDGVGTAMFEALVRRNDVQPYVDFLMNYYVGQWLDAQPGPVLDSGSMMSKFDSVRAFLRQKGSGSGIEKCLYVLEPEAYCLSEKLSKYYVRTPEELMRAFEKIAKGPNRPAMFFDRHIIAFLSVKDRKIIDPFLHDLGAQEHYRRISAEIKTLSVIQKRSQMERFPGIAGWMVEILDPLYERFHDRDLREDVRKKAHKLKESGDLSKIADLFDNPQVYHDDNIRFRRAMRDYHNYALEVEATLSKLEDESSFGREQGRKIAAVVAGVISAIIIFATLFTTIGAKGF